MRKTYKYRIYPTKEQTAKFEEILDICRILYNDCITERRDAWETCHKSISYYDQQNQLPAIKEFDEDLKLIHSHIIQDVLRRVDKAYKNFYRRVKNGSRKVGFPRYKGRNRYDSFTYPQYGNGVKLKDEKLYLSKIGDIRIFLHRDIPEASTIKTCTIKKDTDQWYACFSVELQDAPKKEKIESVVGVDVGLKNIVTLSTGEQIEPPRHLRASEKKLAKEQRRLSRKEEGSENRKKQKTIVVRVHRKIRNQRSDFNHKLSRKLVTNFDLIAFEDLRIKNMLKNHHLAKSISDAGWNQLQNFTSYKAAEAGRYTDFVVANGTTIDCSVCGYSVPKTLATRIHHCLNCGNIQDRDHNAAMNIRNRAICTLGLRGIEACGGVP